jgi:transcription initiation factor IIE alpha subunit
MSIIDSMFDQYYEHLFSCEECKASVDENEPGCIVARRMELGLEQLAKDDRG